MSGVCLDGVSVPALTPGRYQINVTVDELGVAGPYRCRIHERRTGRMIGECWSNGAGQAVFNNLALITGGYYACAFDHTEPIVNAAIADLITPEPMP